MAVVQRVNSLPDLGAGGALKGAGLDQQPPTKGGAGALKGYLPLLDRRSYVYGVGFETVRRIEVVDNMIRFRTEGNLPRLWAAVRRAQLDAHLNDTPTVNDMANVLARATRLKLICENVARRTAKASFSTKDVRVLETALKELEQLKLGPKIWKDPMYPVLQCVPLLFPHLEKLRQLVQEYRAGCARFTAAWLAAVQSGELRLASAIEGPESDLQGEHEKMSALEVSTARWLLAFPDAIVELGLLVSDDVKAEYWRLTDGMEGASSEPELSTPGRLSPADAHLAKLLVLAGSLGNESPRGAGEQPEQEHVDKDEPPAPTRRPAGEDVKVSGKGKPGRKQKAAVEDVNVNVSDEPVMMQRGGVEDVKVDIPKPKFRGATEDVKIS